MRADPMTKENTGRDLILSIIDNQLNYDHNTMKLSGDQHKKAVPSSQHMDLAIRKKGEPNY
eukprot:2344110-Pyramimonas_sp.AAC.1